MRIIIIFLTFMSIEAFGKTVESEVKSLILLSEQMTRFRQNPKTISKCTKLMKLSKVKFKKVNKQVKKVVAEKPKLFLLMSSLRMCLTCNESLSIFHCNEVQKLKGEI